MAEIIKECDNCKHVMTDTESFPCNRCKRNAVDKWEPIPKQTKADEIRAMSDLELSNFIKLVHNDGTCREYAVSHGQAFTDMFGNKGVLAWLQSEAE